MSYAKLDGAEFVYGKSIQKITPEGLGGYYTEVEVTGPMGKPTMEKYGIVEDGRTAVMEMAEAAGNLFWVLVEAPQRRAVSECFRHWEDLD